MNIFLKFFLSIIVLSSIVFAQTRTTIAVMDLSAAGVAETDVKVITSRLRTDLFNTKKYIVLERDKVNEVLNEQGFQQSMCTTNECVVEVGKLIGVQQMVAGQIGKVGNLFTITIRLIEVETGKVLKTATEDCECKIEEVVTQSVKNVAEILAGNKIQTETYSTTQRQSNNTSDAGLSDWVKLGLSREEYFEFTNSGMSIDKWPEYKSKSLNPTTSFWLSFVIPGAGQYYNGDIVKGVLHNFMAFAGIMGMANDFETSVIIAGAGVLSATWIWSWLDARSSAIDYNEELKKKFKLSFTPKLNIYSNQPMLSLNINF